MRSSNETAAYRVFYRCRDGAGTHSWGEFANRSEAVAQQQWCADHSGASMTWVLDASGRMVGDTILKWDVTDAR